MTKGGKKLFLVVCQDWEERERGWGVRPDGHTLHLNQNDTKDFIAGYNKAFNNETSVPDSYTRISGPPRIVAIDKATITRIFEAKRAPEWEWEGKGIWGDGTTGPRAWEG